MTNGTGPVTDDLCLGTKTYSLGTKTLGLRHDLVPWVNDLQPGIGGTGDAANDLEPGIGGIRSTASDHEPGEMRALGPMIYRVGPMIVDLRRMTLGL